MPRFGVHMTPSRATRRVRTIARRSHAFALRAKREPRGTLAFAGGFRRPLFTQDAEPQEIDASTSLDCTFAERALVGKAQRRASFGTTGLSGVVVISTRSRSRFSMPTTRLTRSSVCRLRAAEPPARARSRPRSGGPSNRSGGGSWIPRSRPCQDPPRRLAWLPTHLAGIALHGNQQSVLSSPDSRHQAIAALSSRVLLRRTASWTAEPSPRLVRRPR
jgi:hypothetical protein